MPVELGRAHQRVEQQIAIEQGMVDAMHDRIHSVVTDALAARGRVLAAPAEDPEARYARDVEVARLTRLVRELRAAERSICFGRIDAASGASLHIGRAGLRSEDGAVLLVDWRADAARPFYAATAAAPLGLRRRRHLRLVGRTVADVSDELLDGSRPTSEDVVGDGPLVAALTRARTGRMREAVATLQTEQDAIVRSQHRGITVVDGGPGTGKTIVALHRAAYVLYAFPALAARGVLVFGPNRRFLDYISDVLPSLGEHDVRTATTADLVGVIPTGTDPDERVKGKAELATALARWVRQHQPSGASIEVRFGQESLILDARTVDGAHRIATRGGLAHNPAREVFAECIVGDLVEVLQTRTAQELAAMDEDVAAASGIDLDQAVAEDLSSLGFDAGSTTDDPDIDWDAIRDGLLRDPGIDQAVERVWPRLRADDVLRRFLGDRDELAALLPEASAAELDLLAEGHADGYTDADLPLLDEISALVDGPPDEVFGHIVVDEAQELSPMQWRMLMRRCPARSLTVVGDFAQAGSGTTIRSWADALGPFVGDRFEHHTLTVCYRTTAEILGHVAPLLERIAPDQRPPRSIRHGEGPRTLPVVESELDPTLRELLRTETETRPGASVGVIAPSHRVEHLATVLDGSDAVVVASPDIRGLEFDTVFVIDPAGIEAARDAGSRDLYVAMTRATQRLVALRVTDS